MKSGVHVILDQVAKVTQGISMLAGVRVMVGIPSSTAGRKEGPITNAALGYIHENGAPEVNIPARPFLIPGVKNAEVQNIEDFRKVGKLALEGKPAAAEKGFHAAGLHASNAVRAKITEGPFAPLKPATLAARRSRGRTGTKPLIDTGQLRAAITYVLRKAPK